MSQSLLLIGHSHVNCVQAALQDGPDPGRTRVINIRRLPEGVETGAGVLAQAEGFEPGAICLCLGGNHHNVLGLLEHPLPFSIGAGTLGRSAIPTALMRAIFYRKSHAELAERVFNLYPQAQRLMLNAPPPIADFEHIRTNPGVFADKLHLGPAPPELRLALHGLQSDVVRELAETHGAEMVTTPAELCDGDGFLAARFVNTDPTHGNAAYGRAMLERLYSRVREVA